MKQFLTKKQLQEGSIEEIEQFFQNTVFQGIFSSEVKSKKHAESYKGNISGIRLDGRPISLLSGFLNVPNEMKDIPEGPCAFKCQLSMKAFQEDKNNIVFFIRRGSLHPIAAMTKTTNSISSTDSLEKSLFEMWGVDSCECIGYYHYDNNHKVYVVDDLRKPNFDHIPYYLGDKEKRPIKITFPKEIRGIELDNYYLFTWKLSHKNSNNPYEITIDSKNQPRPIEPKWFIDTLFNDRHNDRSKNFGSAANFLDTLSKQLSAKESTFVYELLQNANDYPVAGKMVDVEFHITDNYLLFLHTGDKFNVRNISGICGINEKEKVANKHTIGYKGIGFKTVFLHNHYVYIQTGEYSFRFDEGETPEKNVGGRIKRLGAPFQILPIWTEHREVAPEVNSVFDSVDKDFRVRLALRPEDKNILHGRRNGYESLFKEIFADANIILFIPNINSVKVFINGKVERICVRDSNEWIVSDYEEEIPMELQDTINKTIDKGNSRIPEKYKDFDRTKVSFACKHEGEVIKPVKKATLYCYLPTTASWGLPFLMNTDMIPKGDRNDIETEVKLANDEESNFNEELAAIAGNKLFSWIKDLLSSRKYDLGSVFSLVPDFKKCKAEHDFYDTFIDRFEDAFNARVEEENIVPVKQGFANVKQVILDTTGLSASGIMTDEEFCKFAEMDDLYLPLEKIRSDKNFNAFLKRYVDDEQKFTVESLSDMIDNEDFQKWLGNQDNNNKFLKFLLDNEYLQDLLEKKIFLEDAGSLHTASDLYYDVDKYLEDLHAFEKYIYFLSPQTRLFFKNSKKWKEVVDGKFCVFDCDEFVNDVLLSKNIINETKVALKVKETSVHFYKFLAENVTFDRNFMSLPFIDDQDNVVKEFNNRFLFFTSKEGHAVCDSQWLSGIQIDFISDSYLPISKSYFKENFEVCDYADSIVIEDIILSEDYAKDVLGSIKHDFEASLNFIKFCYKNQNIIPDKGLSGYVLKVHNSAGKETWFYVEGDTFFNSPAFDYYSQKEWIEANWMAALDDAYFNDFTDKKKIKNFFERTFGVEELTDKSFYCNIVKTDSNLKEIFKNTCGHRDSDGHKNIDFVKYLEDNYRLIFEEEKDSDIFKSLTLVSSKKQDVSSDEEGLYVYDEELKEIIDNEWFPDDIVTLTYPDYGSSRVLTAIGVKKYNFREFFDDIIVENIDAINEAVTSKEMSVDFHNFIIGKLGSLTSDQQAKMKDAKVYLYGQVTPADSASGHRILNAKAKELCNLGLVDFSDMDIIDPDYNPEKNVEYWETRLENSKYNVGHFFGWLSKNTKSFSETLQDAGLNIKFWRWLKQNISDKNKDIPSLPALLKNGSFDNCQDAIYFSDEYLKDAGIEKLVLKFDPNAQILSPLFMEEGDDLSEWISFWERMGVTYHITDILVDTVIPNLASIDDENLPKLLAVNRTELESRYEDGLIKQLADLRVKANDGNFYAIEDTIYVDCEKEEPFPYIKLPNRIAFNSADERRLIKDIIEDIEGDCVKSLSEWQQRKLDFYLKLQEEDSEKLRSIHFQFINALSMIRNNERESLKDLDRIEEIQLLSQGNEFTDASTLTMGSAYNPFFDFEACGIESLDYVSDDYKSRCSEPVGRLFKELNVHYDFEEEDIDLLTDRASAIYFWSKYLLKKEVSISRIKQMIADKKFDNLACIPTKDYMKCPSDLYYGYEISRYVKNVEDWENKVPLKNLPDIKTSDDATLFSLLPFKESLDFLDALYALISITGQEKRTQMLNWMIDDYDESFRSKIDEYREDEHALWCNNKNEKVQIKDLYALDYWDKTLEQYFGQNPRIVNKAYFPAGDLFKKACDILGIVTITADDLRMEPVGDSVFTSRDIEHKLYALVIAGMTDSENWKELYDGYCDCLNKLVLHRCKSIMITYTEDQDINQSLRKFYHKDGENDFYFVDSLDGKRVFKSFVEDFIKFLAINTNNIAEDVIEDIMDSKEHALELVKEQNSLMLDENFKDELDKLIPGIKRELSGNEAAKEEEVDFGYRPTFTTQEPSESDDDDTPDDSDQDANYESDFDGVDEYHGCQYPLKNHTTVMPTGISIRKPNVTTHSSHLDNTGSTSNFGTSSNGNFRKKSVSEPTRPTFGESHDYSDMSGWHDRNQDYVPQKPRPFSPEDVRNFGSHGITRTLDVLEPTKAEVDEINCILGEDLSSAQVADQNYLAQLRLYNNLIQKGYQPEESKENFVRNANLKNEHTLGGGKYIHKCSAVGGIMYLSPSIWNKIADGRCVVCVYLGAKANEFMYFNTLEEILKWIGEDDIVIKLTGEEKVDVVETLYSGVLDGVKGTAYTLIRIRSNEKYNSLFAQLPDKEIEDSADEL